MVVVGVRVRVARELRERDGESVSERERNGGVFLSESNIFV